MASRDEGFASNRPPYFDRSNYNYWKARMSVYLKSQEFGVWTLVVSGYTPPNDKAKAEWSAAEQKNYTANFKDLNSIICALSLDEFRRISNLETAKGV